MDRCSVDKTSNRPQLAQMISSIGTRHFSPAWRASDHILSHHHSLDRPCLVSTVTHAGPPHLCCTTVVSLAVLAHQHTQQQTSVEARMQDTKPANNERRCAASCADHLSLAVIAAAATMVIDGDGHTVSAATEKTTGLLPWRASHQLRLLLKHPSIFAAVGTFTFASHRYTSRRLS